MLAFFSFFKFYHRQVNNLRTRPNPDEFREAFDWPLIPSTNGGLYHPREGAKAAFLPATVLANESKWVKQKLCTAEIKNNNKQRVARFSFFRNSPLGFLLFFVSFLSGG